MVVVKSASAGTLESSDCMVSIKPADTLQIKVESVVLQQFGDEIRSVASRMLEQLGVTRAAVEIFDRGALDCVIEARVETAVKRAAKKGDAQ